MVEQNINYFENLHMDQKKSHEKTSSKFKRYITEITEIKRPPGKTKSLAEGIELCAKSATLPRQSVKGVSGKSKVSKHASLRTEKEEFLHQKAKTKVKGILKKTLIPESTETTNVDIEKKYSFKNNEKTEPNRVLEDYNLLDSFSDSSDDIFGFNDFDDDCSDNYIIETYNKPGQELIITTLEITRKTISRDVNKETLKDLIGNSDYVFHKGEYEARFEESLDALTLPNGECNENNYSLASASNETLPSIFDDEIYQEVDEVEYVNISQNNIGDQHFDVTRIIEDNYFHNVEISSDNDELDNESKNLPSPTRNVEIEKKIRYVIEELIKTEELYIQGLKIVIDEYLPFLYRNTPPHLTGRTSYVFGNIKVIYVQAQEFLAMLKQNNQGPNEIGLTFSDLSYIFELYPQYSKNKPTADIYLKEFDDVVKERQNQLHDKLGLASHLLTPIQRLGKYILMLEKIQKEQKKCGEPIESISKAIQIIRGTMRKGNDFIAIDSIKECKVDLTLQGSFMIRAVFSVLRPRKFLSMVFLFENIIVFTERVSKNTEHFKYIDSIAMSDLSLAKFEDKPCIFHLRDYPKYKKSNNDGVTFVLEADTPKLKNEWTQAIEDKLWSQLQKAKDLQQKTPPQDNEDVVTIRTNLKRGSSIGKKKPKVERSRSKFYDYDRNS